MKNNLKKVERDFVPEKEKALIELTLGSRTPKNSYEKRLLADINKAKQNGQVIEIPGNGIY